MIDVFFVFKNELTKQVASQPKEKKKYQEAERYRTTLNYYHNPMA